MATDALGPEPRWTSTVKVLEADAIDRETRACVAGSGLVVVSGPTGIGKSTAIASALASLAGSGARTTSVDFRGTGEESWGPGRPLWDGFVRLAGERASAFGGADKSKARENLHTLMNVVAVASAPAAFLFPPAALAGAAALIPALNDWAARLRKKPDADPVEVLGELLADGSPAVLHIAGVDALAEPAAESAASVVARLSEKVTFIIEVREERQRDGRSPFQRAIAESIPRTNFRWVDLKAWGGVELRQYLELVFAPHAFSSNVPLLLAEASGGSPLLLKLILEHTVNAGIMRSSDGIWECSDELAIGDLIPHGEHDAVTSLMLARWEALDDVSRGLVGVLSLAGRPLVFEQAADVLGMDRRPALTAWTRLTSARLIIEDSSGRATLDSTAWAEFARLSMSAAERRITHAALSELEEEGTRARARHLLEAGQLQGASDEALFAVELAQELGDWDEVGSCLDLIVEISGGQLPAQLLPVRVRELQRQGRATEALGLAHESANRVPVDVEADLVHLTGRYREASGILDQAMVGTTSPEQRWKLLLRSVHHLKFVDPRLARDRIHKELAEHQPPERLQGLVQYTLWGSIETLISQDPAISDHLLVAKQLAEATGDSETVAKACRKLGEWYEYMHVDHVRADAEWEAGLAAVARSESRQTEYLETVRWRSRRASDIDDFYLGRRRRFARLGIRGWEAHCELLRAERHRAAGNVGRATDAVVLAQSIYEELEMCWGIAAARILRALLDDSPAALDQARAGAAEQGLAPLAFPAMEGVVLLLP